MTKILTVFAFAVFSLFSCTVESDRAALKNLFEKDQIINQVNKLFVSTDNRDWAAVKDCFADSVLFDMTSMAGGDPTTLSSQNIVDAWDQGLKSLKAIHHQLGNYQVSINQNRANARDSPAPAG